MSGYRHLRFFRGVGIDDVVSVGGKNASLGEMSRETEWRAFYAEHVDHAVA